MAACEQDRVLHLSSDLLYLLRDWSTLQTASEQERTLAKQLFEDFSRYGEDHTALYLEAKKGQRMHSEYPPCGDEGKRDKELQGVSCHWLAAKSCARGLIRVCTARFTISTLRPVAYLMLPAPNFFLQGYVQ